MTETSNVNDCNHACTWSPCIPSNLITIKCWSMQALGFARHVTVCSYFGSSFLLLARYVPNIAKRSIWDQCEKYEYWWPMTDYRPISDIGYISATCHPIHFMFASIVGFSRSADRTALLPCGSNARWRPVAILISEMHHPIHLSAQSGSRTSDLLRLVIKRSLVRLPAGALLSQLGQLNLPSLHGW